MSSAGEGGTRVSHPARLAVSGLVLLLSLLTVGLGFVTSTNAIVAATPEPPGLQLFASPTPGATFNVKDFGAVGDGVTDDAQSIRDCIDACYEAGGGTVYIPAGTYRLVTGRDLPNTDNAVMKVHVPLRSGVTVAGDGVGRTILIGQAPEDGLSVMGATDDNVAARDLTSMIPAADKEDTWKSGLKLVGVKGGRFANIYMENTGTASNAVGCDDLVYNWCVGNNTKSGFMVDCQEEAPDPAKIGITFNDCVSVNSSDGDGAAHGFSAYIWESTDAWRVSRVTYNRCVARDNDNCGFYTKWSYRVTYNDCTSERNGWGFYSKRSRFVTFNRCQSNNNGSWGFYLERVEGYLVSRCTGVGNREARFRVIASTARRR